jgi:hypothetical protein
MEALAFLLQSYCKMKKPVQLLQLLQSSEERIQLLGHILLQAGQHM